MCSKSRGAGCDSDRTGAMLISVDRAREVGKSILSRAFIDSFIVREQWRVAAFLTRAARSTEARAGDAGEVRLR